MKFNPIDEQSYFAIRAEAEKDILAANDQGVRAAALRLPFYVYGRAGSIFVPVSIQKAKHDGVVFYVEDGALTRFMTINNQISTAVTKNDFGWTPQAKAGLLDDVENGSYTALRD